MSDNKMPVCLESCKGCFAVGKLSNVCTVLTKCEHNCRFYKEKEQYEADKKKYPISPKYW